MIFHPDQVLYQGIEPAALTVSSLLIYESNILFDYFLIFILAINPISAQDYEIKGKITDSKSGEPMVGVHIVIKMKSMEQ